MDNSNQNLKERQYYIDWLRIILILSVFLFHVGMIFNTWDWHIKNDQKFEWLNDIMRFLHYWRIPLLFLVSGAGTFFALGIRSPKEYLKERSKRLLIPAIAGIFLLVPVQVYLDTNLTERMSQYKSLLDFYPHFLEGIYPKGNFSWHHLYFIIYLFIIALIITPFLKFFRSKKFACFVNLLAGLISRPFGANVLLIPLILSQALLRPFFPEETHALINDWATISFYLIFFLAGFTMLSNMRIVDSICKQRILYLIQSVLFTMLMFKVPSLISSKDAGETLRVALSIIVAWSVSVSAIGYARKYLNINSEFRKIANEAIYPFYLLHQPVIVVTGYYIVNWNVPAIIKFALILTISFFVTVSIYQLFIQRIKFFRIIFGLKPKSRITQQVDRKILQPVFVNNKSKSN
jgi:glucan biosynthesis protein C